MEKFKVTLSVDERHDLEQLIRKGKAAARQLAHARVLLRADEREGGKGRPDEEIAATLHIGLRTIARVRKRFVTEGLEQAVNPRPQPRRPEKIKLSEAAEQHVIELACSDPPDGRGRWTLQLLADRLVVLGHVESVSDETVRKALKKTTYTSASSNRGAFLPRHMRSLSGAWKTCCRCINVPTIQISRSCVSTRPASS